MVLIVIRVLYVAFTEGLYKIQENAAKRVIFKQASTEARIHIAEDIINKITSKSTVGKPKHVEITGENIGFSKKVYITDINKSKIDYILEKYGDSLSDVELHVNIGDEVKPSERLISVNIEPNIGKDSVYQFFSGIFKVNDYMPWEHNVRERLNKSQAFDDYLAKIEQDCKKSIDRGNIIQLKYYLRSYKFLAGVIGHQRRGYKNERVELPELSKLLANSLNSVFAYQYNSYNHEFTNSRESQMLSEIIRTIQKSHEYSEERLVSNTHQPFVQVCLSIIDRGADGALNEHIDTTAIKEEMKIE